MSNVVLPELEVMQTIANAIDILTPAQKMRVAAWLSAYAANSDAQDEVWDEELPIIEEDEEVEPVTYETFADLYEAVAPKTAIQKVATAAWWIQTELGKPTWKASEANKLLKGIDVRISSISIVLTNSLKSKNPLVVLVSRNADSSRSRKTFELSEAGLSYVEERIA